MKTSKTNRCACSVLGLALAWCGSALAETPVAVPLVTDRWIAGTGTQFLAKEGFPKGILDVNGTGPKDAAVLRDMDFGDGTIEFDMKPLSEGTMPGIRFHQRDDDTAEEVYVRVSPDCPASQDCMQYAPMFLGRMLWDSYIQYQHSAPVRVADWNHFKLVISGKAMNVFVNGSPTPSLMVDELQGEATHGGIRLVGPAKFANLTLSPGLVDGMVASPRGIAAADDPRFLSSWSVTAPTAVPDDMVTIGMLPKPSLGWSPIEAEGSGLLNLARRFARTTKSTTPLVAWLKTTVNSDEAQTKRVSMGFLRVASVFVNGQRVFAGRNNYNVEGGRRAPDGRIGLENSTFEVPLHKGDNEIVVALRSNTPDMRDQYGFGMMFRFDDAEGIRAPR